ncbi:MAG TPA: hypothetical protein VNI54_02340 [Thermoanaerobaculia bacterium]|nr:hypothetical protein [Thermoanaerobaculia bacterium]
MNVRAAAGVVLLVVAATAAFAHDTADAVVFTLVDAQMETIRDPLTADVRFQATPESDLIYRISPRVPGPLTRGRDIVEATAFTDFGDDRQANVGIELPPMVRERWSPTTLFYLSKEIRVPVAISYAVRAEPVRTIEAFHISVTPRAPFLGIVLGGVLGVLATLLFLFLLGLRDDHKKVLTKDYLIRGLARFALGVIVTLLVVFLLLYAPKQIDNLPIKADVKDWVGGFIVGLFSQFLAEWFAKKLRPEEPAAQPQPTP